jgi:hypothetical protein
MRFAIVVTGVAFLLGGCNTTQQAELAMQTRWKGQKADEFFIAHGLPQSEFTLSDGRKMFSWKSGTITYGLPGSAQSRTTVLGGMALTNTTYTPGGSVDVFCSAQIIVGRSGLIEEIRPHEDTIGRWNTSRCAELFGA